MQMPDEIFKTLVQLHNYYHRAILDNERAITELEAENIFFQDQLNHANALSYGFGHQAEKSEINHSYSELQISESLRTNSRLSSKYQGLSLICAITKVLQKHCGQALNAADIAEQILPPRYSKEHRAFLRNEIARVLRLGVKEGRFDRALKRGRYICKVHSLEA